MAHEKNHDYHIINPSLWPFLSALGSFYSSLWKCVVHAWGNCFSRSFGPLSCAILYVCLVVRCSF